MLKLFKRLALGTGVLVAILAIEAVLLMLITGSLFNSVRLPIIDNADFIWLLLTNSPWPGFLELINQPLLIIGEEQGTALDFTTALFFYLPGSLLHLLLAYLLTRFLLLEKRQVSKGLVTGVVLILLSLPNIWLASCCGDVPGWSVDVALRQYVFAVGGDPVSRLSIYESLLPLLTPLRLIIGAAGFGLLYRRITP